MPQHRAVVNSAPFTSPWPSPIRAWYAVAILFIAYALSFVDRTILSLLVDPIRRDFDISDTQVSLLQGFAFAIFYTLLGVPIARLADRGSRRGIIASSAFAWSFACAACGFAKNFSQLFLGRIGVGVGEAGLSPAAYSMLADLFPPTRLGLAMSAYTSAIYVGAGLSLIIGGTVVAAAGHSPAAHWPVFMNLHPWQLTFVIVGLPGLVLGGLLWTVREPQRRLRLPLESSLPRDEQMPATTLRWTLMHLRKHAGAYSGYIFGFTSISVIYNVAVAWGPTFLIRRLGLSTPQAGYWMGTVMLVSGVTGVLLGGLLADILRDRGRVDATVLVGLVSVACATPCGALAFQMSDSGTFLILFAVMLFGTSMAFGAAAAGIQALSPNRMRAQASAIYLFTLNILAVGLGPTSAALITDFGFHDDLRVGDSVTMVICVAAPLAWCLLIFARKPFIACALALREV
jgi:MFS family permease